MKIDEGCRFLEKITNIPIHILDSDESINDFCTQNRIHKSQGLFSLETIKKIIEQLDDRELILCIDAFKIRVLFALFENTPIAYGPYCTELFSVEEVALLLSFLNISDIPAITLARLRGKLTVKAQKNVEFYLNSLFSELSNKAENRTVKTIKLPSTFVHSDNDSSQINLNIKSVREHYANEQLLMKSIEKADFEGAINAWHILHKTVSFLKIGQTLEVAKIAAAITRTMLRIGAIAANLPAEINDKISGNSAKRILDAKSIDAINNEHERVIKEYCDIISEYKKKKYSSSVLSAICFLENNFSKQIHLEDLADELSISSSQLIHQFKRETNYTPIAYLNKIRMKNAANALIETECTIPEIAESVGISDPNYFIKCFKKEFNITPAAYRKMNC